MALHYDRRLSGDIPLDIFASGSDKRIQLTYHDETDELSLHLEHLDWKDSLPALTSLVSDPVIGAAALIIQNDMKTWGSEDLVTIPPLEFTLRGSLRLESLSLTSPTAPSWDTPLYHHISHIRKESEMEGQNDQRLRAFKSAEWMAKVPVLIHSEDIDSDDLLDANLLEDVERDDDSDSKNDDLFPREDRDSGLSKTKTIVESHIGGAASTTGANPGPVETEAAPSFPLVVEPVDTSPSRSTRAMIIRQTTSSVKSSGLGATNQAISTSLAPEPDAQTIVAAGASIHNDFYLGLVMSKDEDDQASQFDDAINEASVPSANAVAEILAPPSLDQLKSVAFRLANILEPKIGKGKFAYIGAFALGVLGNSRPPVHLFCSS
ncbi:hypothetical protein H0H87_007269 [Tephrocybe sp. NHM501043]|nr:hypothetical protein H0H87_007269 [Tephrocybe sp. NHM501043]